MNINFICVGAQKAGTTTLHDILKDHKDIFLPEKKEAHFFDINSRYKKGLIWWKNEFFSNYDGEKSVGVFTPEYLFYDEVPKRILSNLGSELKIIIILRNPIERAYSHYLMSRRRGYEKLSFDEAIKNENSRINKDEFNRNNFSYIARGMYFDQLNKYYSLFSNQNILVLNFEKDIVNNLDLTINTIQKFIGVNVMDLKLNIKSNRASDARYKLINVLLNRSWRIKRIFNSIIKNKEFRLYLRKKLIKFNRVESTKKLDFSQKRYFLEKYFLEDILKTEKAYKLDLKHWYKNEN
jgi:hypothetical protein